MSRERTFLIAAAGLLAATSAAARAQAAEASPAADAQQSFAVVGSAPQVCALQAGQIEAGALVNVQGLDGDTLRIEQFIDPQTLASRAARATIAFSAFCNFPHQVRLESQNNGLWPTDGRQGASQPGFATAVPYDARLRWGTINGRLAADATVRQIATQRFDMNDATTGDLTLSIEVQQGSSNGSMNAPVLAGAYADTLRIYLEPR